MESRQSLVLCIVYALFLILGAVMFMFLEYEVSETRVVTEPPEWSHLKELALKEDPPADEDKVLSLATWLPRACEGITNYTINSLVTPGRQVGAVRDVEHLCPHLHQEDVTVHVSYPWSFIDALYFSMTVTTTIGYGHISPTLAAGRIVCILYSLVGIPLTGILLAWTSEFFGELLFKLFKSKLDAKKQHSHGVIALATTIYIAIGFVVFIFVPGAVFTFLEEWTYIEGIYYAYITLTTIGFGDFVTGKSFAGATLYVYQICVILWIMIGLGYWVMVANFITKALKSKRLQSSVLRSAEEMKKIMQQMGIKNHDPTFLRQHSKATVNLMLQLSNIIAVQGGVENGVSASKKEDSPDSPGTSSTATSSPPLSPMGIPGISALFGVGLSRTPPLSQLMGPMRNEPPVMPRKKTKQLVACEKPVDLSDEAPVTMKEKTETKDSHPHQENKEQHSYSNPDTFCEDKDSALATQSNTCRIMSTSQVMLKLEADPIS